MISKIKEAESRQTLIKKKAYEDAPLISTVLVNLALPYYLMKKKKSRAVIDKFYQFYEE